MSVYGKNVMSTTLCTLIVSVLAITASVPAQAAVAQSNAAQSTPEARIKQLNKLLAGGYITQQEYNAKKQEIINSL